MLKRLSIAGFLGCLITAIAERTGIPCYDSPEDKESPFYSVQLVRSEPADTKTMYVDVYSVWVHCISEPVRPRYSNAPVLELVQALEEAMSDGLALPEPHLLYRQVYDGMQTLKMDETGEGHAVLSFAFHVCYGFRCK
ncbi:DUF5072 domain-containing protein [Coriobacteriales bacterium OH1046]|nr:DUF5072 domain-containing protein [Coriobacteriales bacterium OH1046]